MVQQIYTKSGNKMTMKNKIKEIQDEKEGIEDLKH